MDGKMSIIKTVTMVSLLALSAILVVGTPALAQNLVCGAGGPGKLETDPDLPGPKELLRPITGTPLTLTATVDYTYTQGAWSIEPVTATVSATSDQTGYTLVTVAKSTVPLAVPAGATSASGGGDSFTVPITVQFTKDAPAFQPVEITLTVNTSGGSCVNKAEQSQAFTTVTADFYSKFQARLDKTIVKTGQNSQVTLPLVLQNFGNGQIIVDFERILDSKAGEDMKVVTPPPAVVESRIAGGQTNTANINLDVNTPFKNGYENRLDQVRMKLTPKSFDDTNKKGDPAEVSALIRTQGVYVPAFDVPLALLGIALAGFLAVRRRQ